MRKSQSRFKYDYGRRVSEASHITPNTYVSLDSPPLRANLDTAAKSLSSKEYNELQS